MLFQLFVKPFLGTLADARAPRLILEFDVADVSLEPILLFLNLRMQLLILQLKLLVPALE